MGPRSKALNWCFTCFDFSETFLFLKEISKYYIIGLEKCPESKKMHYQGYINLNKKMRLSGLKKYNPKISWRICKGTPTQNINYCSKENKFFEWGTKPKGQGSRNDISLVKDIINNGGNMREVLEKTSSYQGAKFGELYLKYFESNFSEKVTENMNYNSKKKVFWFWGKSGTGKTKTAFEKASKDCWISGKNLKWWDGYDGQKNIIIDDFRKDFCTFHELLRIIDKVPYRIEFKGGSRMLRADNIYITTCYPPEELYDTREDIYQLLRRIDEITEFKNGSEVVGNTKTTSIVKINNKIIKSLLLIG